MDGWFYKNFLARKSAASMDILRIVRREIDQFYGDVKAGKDGGDRKKEVLRDLPVSSVRSDSQVRRQSRLTRVRTAIGKPIKFIQGGKVSPK
jgi:hypothetical protein